MTRIHIGVVSAVAAQIMWGLFPIYWKLLEDFNPLEVLSHRNIWCTLFLGLLILASTERRRIVAGVLASRAEIIRHSLAGCLIALNWLVYIWAVVNNHVIDASLGYFLSPLVSVALGYFVFAERPGLRQWGAVALAAVGVLIMIIASGVVPWIGLTLAATFGIYGMARKKAPTGPINGLFLETLMLVPVSFLALGWLFSDGGLSYTSPLGNHEVLLALSGLVTALPLVLYAQGARALPLSLSGLLVYITPSMQFLIGWLFYHESISTANWVGFCCIWAALILYSVGSTKLSRADASAAKSQSSDLL